MANIKVSQQELQHVCEVIARDFLNVQYCKTEKEHPMFTLELKVYDNKAPEVSEWIWRCERRMNELVKALEYYLQRLGIETSTNWKNGGNWRTIPGEYTATYLWAVFVIENGLVASLY